MREVVLVAGGIAWNAATRKIVYDALLDTSKI
jgi:hypothetical protein